MTPMMMIHVEVNNNVTSRRSSKHTRLLWAVQGLLALLFVFAGVMKLTMPVEALTAQSPLPGWFLRFIGAVEVLGAIGLILPGRLRIPSNLRPLAAIGLTVIMIGATAMTIVAGILPAIFPIVVGLLAALIAYSHRNDMFAGQSVGRSILQPAA